MKSIRFLKVIKENWRSFFIEHKLASDYIYGGSFAGQIKRVRTFESWFLVAKLTITMGTTTTIIASSF